MNIHEYQGKELLGIQGVKVPFGIVAFTAKEARQAAEEVKSKTGTDTWAIKPKFMQAAEVKAAELKLQNH